MICIFLTLETMTWDEIDAMGKKVVIQRFACSKVNALGLDIIFFPKIWNLGSLDPNFTLDAHQKGVNCVDYFTGGDKPYLITRSDDHTTKRKRVACEAIVETGYY
ncbi:coatomer subunit beta'-3 [Arachis duranensis]|uniref:Coatomer subunit beta'-3 n=1 Tax=Arachis duranensis TaxID=130453 RepID=A0A9C6TV06_ARADU|nr:coatomer subunit beta'-3 [Arachis duranensis]